MPIREDFSTHLLSFEKLTYCELDLVIKKLWMEFEIEWDKKCVNKDGYNQCKGNGEDLLNTGEVLMKKAFSKTYKKLCANVYEGKARGLNECED